MKKINLKLTEHENFYRRLAYELRNHSRRTARGISMVVQRVPFINDVTWQGVLVNDYVIPKVKDAEVVAVFDALIEYIIDPYSRDDITENAVWLIKAEAWKFAIKSRTSAEMILRLLYLLSRIKTWALAYDAHGVTLSDGEATIGLRDGAAISPTKRINGIKIEAKNDAIDPHAFYTGEGEMKVWSRHFVSLYREAYRVGGDLPRVLIALASVDPGFKWKSLADVADMCRTPSQTMMAKIEDNIFTVTNPNRYLYGKLVPWHMRLADYRKYIGNPYAKPRTWDNMARAKLFSRVSHYFTNIITGEQK